jgi:hypothetical protein
MLIIRQQQLETFAEATLERFESRLIDHLRSAWPRECGLIGDDRAMRHCMRRIIRFAHANGYDTSRQLTLYAMLVFILGIGFDTDPQLNWAGSALRNDAIENPTARIEQLYDETIDYLGAVGGDDSERVECALARVRGFDFAAAPTSMGDERVEDLCGVLGGFWPEKLEFQETSPTLTMIAAGIDKAGRYGITSPMGVCIFTMLGYFLGHQFDVDPVHPWAASVLTAPALHDGDARAKGLLDFGLNSLAQSLTRE